MEITEELIESFFNHNCTPQEARAVAEYLSQNPGEAEKFLGYSEWESTTDNSDLSEAYWEEQWKIIERKRTKKKRLVFSITRYAAAAIVIFMAATGIYYLADNKSGTGHSAGQAITETLIESIENTDDTPRVLTLSDGSMVELMQGSAISLKRNFDEDRREIYLTGEAIFNVAKDSLRPFTVYSGNISTTALGTRFRVVYSKNEGDASVFLYEGKVLIQSYYQNKLRKAYLQPGDQLSYVHHTGKMEVDRKGITDIASGTSTSLTQRKRVSAIQVRLKSWMSPAKQFPPLYPDGTGSTKNPCLMFLISFQPFTMSG